MRRPIARTLTVGSLLVALAAAAVWIATTVVNVRWDYGTIDRSAEPVERATVTSLSTAPHQLQLVVSRVRMDRGTSLVTLNSYIPVGLTWQRSTPGRGAVNDARRLLPAVVRRPSVDTGFGVRSTVAVAVPIWPVVVAGALLPAWRLRRWWTRRTWTATACRRCGYDRRGASGTCPECGAV